MASLRLKPFQYFEPGTISETVQLLNTYGEKSRILAGGIDLIPRMRAGSVKADYVINIQNIPELSYFKHDENFGTEFGAMTTLQFLDNSIELKSSFPIVQQAIHQITSVQSKYMGTAVGNICVATPASDVSPALMAYDAEIIIAGINGIRRENINHFFVAYQKTSLKRDEFVIGVFIPRADPEKTGAAFINRVRTHADIAKITVSVVVEAENDICNEARIAIGSVAPTAVRAVKAEAALRKQKISSEIIKLASEYALECARPITDIRSTQDYRMEMTRVLVGRALEKAFKAQGG